MRFGFTTGSCAAAAAKAATYMLLGGKERTEIQIMTPKKIPYQAKILDICQRENQVSCAVEKDGGDDPDLTTGLKIYATVSYGERKKQRGQNIFIEGGEGVGRVTKPGLDQPVGQAAINRVPRQMIEAEVQEVCNLFDYEGSLLVEISAPGGNAVAKQTFNPRLGIVGGISIIGTSGIVEPMSSQALLDTIRVELRQRRELGYDYVAVTPGNYGLDFMKRSYGYDLDRSVKCSNFIGDTIDMAVELGFEKMLITGHMGKLVKVAGGIMNTHSREADCRMELLAAIAIRHDVDVKKVQQLFDCVTTEDALQLFTEEERNAVMKEVVDRICYYMEKRGKGKLKVDCIVYTNELGELARSKEAKEWFTLLEQEQEL